MIEGQVENKTSPGNLPLAITCGDPAGVGPELILDWAKTNRGRKDAYVFLGPENWMSELRSLGYGGQALGQPNYCAVHGQPDRRGSLIAIDAMLKAAQGCFEGKYCGVVPGPVI